MQTFGELTEEAMNNRKYAKWKAAYIHNCLKNGETPMPGPMQEEGGDDENNAQDDDAAFTAIPQPPPASESPVDNTEDNEAENIESPPNAPTAEEVLNNPEKLPSPPVEEEKPGGFEPFVPPAQPHPVYTPPTPVANVQITPDQMIKAQKYCKYAGSALNYDDVKTAIDNLQKALTLLTTGQDV